MIKTCRVGGGINSDGIFFPFFFSALRAGWSYPRHGQSAVKLLFHPSHGSVTNATLPANKLSHPANKLLKLVQVTVWIEKKNYIERSIF